MNTHWTERLSEYLDGELSPADHAACEAHLAECVACADTADELRAVVAAARAEVARPPARDLWPAIAAQLQPVQPALAAVRPRRTVALTLPQLALAASLLVAVSAGVSYLASGRTPSASPREDAIQAQAEPLVAPLPTAERANFADAQYNRAVADLERMLLEQRDHLDPRTVIVIERNLNTIDQAIREAHAALEADPANTFLNSHLVDARRKKLELLRRATTIYSTSGD